MLIFINLKNGSVSNASILRVSSTTTDGDSIYLTEASDYFMEFTRDLFGNFFIESFYLLK